MEPIPNVTSRPLTATRSSVSTPLMDVQIYRPGPYVALAVLVAPVVVALAGATISLNMAGAIPVWLPFVLLLWLPGLPIVWLTMQSVRTSSYGIAAGRPWRVWEDIPWSLVERVDLRGMTLRITGSDGKKLVVILALLRDGDRLKRQLLLRLPAHVLAGAMAHDAHQFFSTGIYVKPEGGLSGTLHARPQAIWRGALVAGALVALAGGVVALLKLPLGPAIPLAAVALAVAGAATRALLWTMQEVIMNEKGISVIWRLSGRSQEMPWSQVELVEHSTREALLRLRGTQKLQCAGPGLMSGAHRDLMRAFLHEYCGNRDVPIMRRTWMI